MAFQASIAAIGAENHDATETKTRISVLANIDDDEDDDDFELRSVSSYHSQRPPTLPINLRSQDSFESNQLSNSELKQSHSQYSLSQKTPSQRSISLSELQLEQQQDKSQLERQQDKWQHQQQDKWQHEQQDKWQLEQQPYSKPIPPYGEDTLQTGQSITGNHEVGTKDDKTVSFADEHPEHIPPPAKERNMKEKIFILLDSPKSSKFAFGLSLLLLGVVILSTFTFLIGSLPEYWTHPPYELFIIEAFCVSVFLLEYLTKLFTCPAWKKWIVSPLSIIDLLAIIPFFLEFVITSKLGSIAVIRVIRLIRIFRIFKLGKFSITMTIVGRTIMKAREGILLLVFLVVLSLLIFASAMFYAEQAGQTFDEDTKTWIRDDGTESPFQSIPATFWWCAVTLTTTGYGDQFPTSWPGRAIAMLTMFCGILVIAFPVTIINTHFQDTWEEVRSAQRQKREEKKYTKKGVQSLDRTVRLLLKRNYLMLEQMAEMNLQLQRYQYQIAQMNNLLESVQGQIPRGRIGISMSSTPTFTDTDTATISTTT